MKFNKNLIVMMAFVCFVSLTSALTLETGTEILNTCLGDSFNITQDSTVDFLVINSTCAGDANNLTAFFNPNNLYIENTNDSAGTLYFYVIDGKRITFSNGTIIDVLFQQTFGVTLPASESLTVLNYPYQVNQGVCTSLLNLHTFTTGYLGIILLTVMFGILLSVVIGMFYFGASSDVKLGSIVSVAILVLIFAIIIGLSALVTTTLCNLSA